MSTCDLVDRVSSVFAHNFAKLINNALDLLLSLLNCSGQILPIECAAKVLLLKVAHEWLFCMHWRIHEVINSVKLALVEERVVVLDQCGEVILLDCAAVISRGQHRVENAQAAIVGGE